MFFRYCYMWICKNSACRPSFVTPPSRWTRPLRVLSINPRFGGITRYWGGHLGSGGYARQRLWIPRYSTSFGERESLPFHEEPETFISILISTTPMHLEPFVMHSALPARPHLDRIAKKKKKIPSKGDCSGPLRQIIVFLHSLAYSAKLQFTGQWLSSSFAKKKG